MSPQPAAANSRYMWDRPPSDADTGSALVLVNWPAQVRASSGGEERQLLGMMAEMDLVVFGGLLTSDDGRQRRPGRWY